MTDDSSRKIDASVPHSARVWNCFLGGKDNYEVDREAARRYRELFPQIDTIARTDRAFLGRAVRYMAGEEGIRQFLDIGTGLPTMDNTHEVAQRVAPESRIVYVDNDPLVLVHAQALLNSSTGVTDYIEADLREPEMILAKAANTLDFDQPIGLMLLGILHFVEDFDLVRRVVAQLVEAVPSGSHLALTHATFDIGSHDVVEANAAAQADYNANAAVPLMARTKAQILQFFDGLELVEPGLVSMSRWRPEAIPFGEPPEVAGFCGVGRKP
ncbi:SAM-dependent methyltransferase [Sphaerisporangium perillae]|uniref:SAM-dependent methyltransferase n=1 Tax=Sphaerisporangium perillae TaxID=2935860 RepID=UPI00200CA808|nr:SAM-dependent methyltransferase [Sphaerisporangium perillae]